MGKRTSGKKRPRAPRSAVASPAPTKLRGWRRRLVQIVPFTVFPALAIVLLEIGLRIFGFGYPPGFTVECEVNGRKAYSDNAEFTRRFFPGNLVRPIRPFVMPAEKSPETFRVFVLGGSAALGDPRPSYGFAPILEVMLRDQYPDVRFEVFNAAVTAINSHVVLEIAKDLARRDGDLFVVYMGNNEVVGPFGAGTVFGPAPPSLSAIRATVFLKGTRIGQLLLRLIHAVRSPRKPAPRSWRGMEMFLEQQVRADESPLEKTYRHFERNLTDICRAARGGGSKVVVCTVATNLKDCAPFASQHRQDLTDGEKTEWDKIYQAGIGLETAGNHKEAVQRYLKAAAIDDRYADLQYRLGRCCWALEDYAWARERYALACDYDTLRFRADTRINERIRSVADNIAAEGIHLADAAWTVGEHSLNGSSGEEMFYDHVHMTFKGNYLLAQTIFEEVADVLPDWVQRRGRGDRALVQEAECARRLALTGWDRHGIVSDMLSRMKKPPFTDRLDHDVQVARLRRKETELRTHTQPDGLQEAAELYEEAIRNATPNWELRLEYAQFLMGSHRDVAGMRAAEQLRIVLRQVPHHPAAHSLTGMILFKRGKTDDALAHFMKGLRDPSAVGVRANLAGLLYSTGRAEEAIGYFSEALRIDPDFAYGHRELGKILALQGKTEQSIDHYNRAIRIDPDDADTHKRLGDILGGEGRLDEAAVHFAEAVRINPRDAAAHNRLGMALGMQGKVDLAISHLTAALGINPQDAEAHNNLGIALARQRRIAEAAEHFAEALRINPSHRSARENLAGARAWLKQHRRNRPD